MTRTAAAFDLQVALVGVREIWRCIRRRQNAHVFW